MVASTRYADQFDGFFAVAPGFNLPKAAVAQLWGAQQWASVATTVEDLETALPLTERRLVAAAILARCDRLDGLRDGMVQQIAKCQNVFDVWRHVPTCTAERDGSCLTRAQKRVVADVFRGARTSSGKPVYSSFPFDPGIVQPGWATWKFRSSVGAQRDPVSVGFVFTTPPADVSIMDDTLSYALNFDVDTDGRRIYTTSGIYTQSAMQFMTPPDPTRLDTLRGRGAKMIVAHGGADGVFSPDDTARWHAQVQKRYRNKAGDFVRYFQVPAMGHSRGGPATDQFDGLQAIIDWVERGQAPDRIVATARGAGNPGGVNPDIPASWAPDRSRPLCPHPSVAIYIGGDPEVASSFTCWASTPTRKS